MKRFLLNLAKLKNNSDRILKDEVQTKNAEM